jgi:hypothetical protein
MAPFPLMAKSAVCHSGRLAAKVRHGRRFYAEFEKSLREPSGAAKEFFTGNILPACGLLISKHLSTWTGPRI